MVVGYNKNPNVLFFKNQDLIVPVYTTRPETIFGATNLFYNPNRTYVEANVNGQRIISEVSSLEEIIYSLFDNPSIKIKGRLCGHKGLLIEGCFYSIVLR